MPLLVLPPRYTPDTAALWKAAIEAGWEVERLAGWRAPEYMVEQDVVLYGEPLFAAVVASSLEISLLEPPFSWLTTLGDRFLRRHVRFSRFSEARQTLVPAFIKPADDKCFTAKVYQTGAELPASDAIPQSTPVLISEPVDWEIEFRCFVLSRQVRAMSPYLRCGELAQDEDGQWKATPDQTTEALSFAETILRDRSIRLPPAVVVDVGRIAGRGWAVIEANAAWGSGIYGCDPKAVLDVVRRASVRSDAITDEDRPWIVHRKSSGT